MALSKIGFSHRRFTNRPQLLDSYAYGGCQFSKRGNVSTDHLLVQSGAHEQLHWWIVGFVPKPAVYEPKKGPSKPWESVFD